MNCDRALVGGAMLTLSLACGGGCEDMESVGQTRGMRFPDLCLLP